MQVNAIVIIISGIALCALGLLFHDSAQDAQPSTPSAAALASASLDIAEPELVMRRALTQVTGAAAVELRRGLGRVYEREWRLAAAQTELLAALAAAPPPLRAAVQLDLARVCLKRGDLQGAHDAAEAAVGGAAPEVGVSECDIARLRGDVAKAAGRYEVAASRYEQARAKATDQDDVARIAAAECDLLQLERRLAPARQRCEQALARQTIGHPERPATLKTLGLIYYFGGEPKRALGLHTRSAEGFSALGDARSARWLREFAIDDEAQMIEEAQKDAAALTPFVAELEGLLAELHQGDETLWWRVSDGQLRLADLLRKQQRFPEAERAVQAGLAAFEQRPAGWARIPDYATIFELAGLVAKDQGKLEEARKYLEQSLRVLEGIIGASVDTTYLREEIEELQKAIGEHTAHVDPAPLEWSPL